MAEPSDAPPVPWYGSGLAFECTRCGHCCTGEPGSVRLDAAEAAALARHFSLPEPEFRARYTRLLDDGALSLIERSNHDCVFWDRERGCLVYALRPRQCRTWPFWRKNLASPAHWAAAARRCPGIGRGAMHDSARITELALRDGTSGVVPETGELA